MPHSAQMQRIWVAHHEGQGQSRVKTSRALDGAGESRVVDGFVLKKNARIEGKTFVKDCALKSVIISFWSAPND